MSAALVIDGHPNPDSLTAAIARRYAEAHGDARVLALRDLDFDVHLRHGYRAHMPLEPDLVAAKEALHAAKRVVVATPLWWGSVPALLKGFFDRALLPQEEYRYTERGLPVGLLAGRRGRILLLADTPRLLAPALGVSVHTQLRRSTLGLVGIKPAPVRRYFGVQHASPARIEGWLDDARRLGRRDARADAAAPAPQIRTRAFADAVRTA